MGRLDLRDPVRDEDLTPTPAQAEAAAVGHWFETVVVLLFMVGAIGLLIIYAGLN